MNSNELTDLYDPLGIKIDTLGRVMLDVDLPGVAAEPPIPWYTTKNPSRFWIKGQMAGHGHVTLLYGIIKNFWLYGDDQDDAERYTRDIARVLDGWEQPPSVVIDSVDTFDSPCPDEPYKCIIGHVAVSEAIQDAHDRLSLLPHIDTFPGYLPHVTLGYVALDGWEDSLARLRAAYEHRALQTVGLNYGKMP